MRYLGKRGDTGGKAGRALARLGTRTWNTDPALSLFRPGLDLLNNRIGSIARWIHRIACKVERRVEMKTGLHRLLAATWPIKLKTSHCSLTMIGLHSLAPKSNRRPWLRFPSAIIWSVSSGRFS